MIKLTTASTRDCTASPMAWITIEKNRQKTYNDTVYLKNNVEFEIELFNPTDTKILAYISINGKRMGRQGLILKPGQRFHLDRFLQENKKLLFETYEVDSEDNEVKKAIENNGSVIIEFYKEKIQETQLINISSNIYEPLITYYDNALYRTISDEPRTRTLSNITSTNSDSNINSFCKPIATMDSVNCFFDSTSSNVTKPKIEEYSSTRSFSKKIIETGRVEKGSTSKQIFNEQEFTSESLPCRIIEYKLSPISQKPISVDEINEEKKFCTECGKKIIKKGFKFCPNCGEKI